MHKNSFRNRILVSITGGKTVHWKRKLAEIRKSRLKKVALFLEIFDYSDRKGIYEALPESGIRELPMVHARNDMKKWEFELLEKEYKTKCFTIHENTFNVMDKWKGLYKKLYLETNYNNRMGAKVDVSKVGGFCVDLSHFKSAEDRWSKEFEYIFRRKEHHKYFKCNHLNGYNPKKKVDMHTVFSIKDFAYLRTLPKFVFGKYIGIEVFNSIEEQLYFKRYLVKMLDRHFGYE